MTDRRFVPGRMTVRRVGVFSLGKMMGALYGLMGLILGLIVALVSLVGKEVEEPSRWGALLGIGAVVLFPLAYGAFAFVAGILTAFLYNALAEVVGGVDIETT